MSNDEHVPAPDDRRSGREATAPAPAVSRDPLPVCPTCESPVPAGAHACRNCRQFLPDPYAGRLATPKRRLAAECLDSIFQDGGILGSIWPAILPAGEGAALVSVLSGIYWATSIYLWTKGTTPAKRLLGMTVVGEDGEPPGFFRMAFRETIGKAISGAILGLGLISVASDDENRGWHEMWAGTWVVREDDD
jgi:uncharacterized RDD family membrane protein YckC